MEIKKLSAIVILFVFLLIGTVHARIWTDKNGKQITGEFIGISQSDNSIIKIKTTTGGVFFIDSKNLSLADQNYLQKINVLPPIQNTITRNTNVASNTISEKDANDPNKTVVTVIGVGETIEDAKKDAMRSAVERVTGSFVDAKTKLDNDDLTEQIITASSAYIEKSEILASKKVNGLVKVKMRAVVVNRSYIKKDSINAGGQSLVIDGANQINKFKTKNESETNGALFLVSFLNNEKFPYSLIDVKFVNEPEIVQNGDNYTYTLILSVYINRSRYKEFAQKIKQVFDEYAIQHSSFILKTEKDKSGNIRYYRNNAPGYSYEGSHLPLYLCTDISGYYQDIKFDIYELPIKFLLPIYCYKRVAPCAQVVFLDNNNNVVAKKGIMLCPENLEPINAMPSMFNSLRRTSSPQTIYGESTTIECSMTNFWGLAVFAPYLRTYDSQSGTFYIVPRKLYKIQMTFSAQELEKIQTANVTVSSQNPKLDKMLKAIPEQLKKLPTN